MSKQNEEKILKVLEEIRDGLKPEKLIPSESYLDSLFKKANLMAYALGTYEVKEAKEFKPKKKLRPESGDRYYGVTGDGFCSSYYIWNDDSVDQRIWDCGNGFFTKEEAEKELAKRKAKQKIKDYIIENGLEFEVDGDRTSDYRWGIYYDLLGKRLMTTSTVLIVELHSFYFATKAHAEQVIKDCKDSLLILFDVKE